MAPNKAMKATKKKAIKKKAIKKTGSLKRPAAKASLPMAAEMTAEEEKKLRLWREWHDYKNYNKSFGLGCENFSTYYQENKNRPLEDIPET